MLALFKKKKLKKKRTKTDRSKDSRTIRVLLDGSDRSGSVSESVEPVHSLVWPKDGGGAVFLAQ